MADVAASLKDWSTTASSNSPTDATTIGAGLADNFQQLQATVRTDLASKGADIASATTTDLGAVPGLFHDITGTTTITSFGTVGAGIWKIIKFEGALTLTHNATSLILPGGANIVTADGDVAIMFSEGAGNWRCVSFAPMSGTYSPSITNGTNVAASTSRVASYFRVGNAVNVSGQLDIDPTSTGATDWTISLPIPSNFAASNTGMGGSGVSSNGFSAVYIEPNQTSDTAAFSMSAAGTANQTITYNFTYRII